MYSNDKIFEIVSDSTDQFKIMLDTFCNVITERMEDPYDFEDDLLNQARLMESIRISNNEKRLISLSEIK